MSHTKRLFVFAGAALSLGAASVALAGESVSRDEVRAIVAEVLADSETRSSLLQGGGAAGYDKNFFLASVDNNYRLNFSGYAQFRYNANFRDNEAAPTDDFEGGFNFARVRLEWGGHVVTPELKYFISGDFADTNTSDGNFNLKDAFVDYDFQGGWYFKAGQFKAPFLREELVSDSMQLSVERGLVNSAFTGGRTQGIEFGYRDEAWWLGVGFNDGFRTANTDWNNATESDWAFGARAEYAFAGNRNDFKAFTSMQEDDFKALVGAAIHYQGYTNTNNAADTDPQYLAYTLDLTLKGGGFSAFIAFTGANLDTNDATAVTRDDFGLAGQLGWRFVKDTEAFVRYDGIYLDDDAGAGRGVLTEENYNFITFGVNHYFAGHAAKLTVDVVVALEQTSGAGRLTGTSVLPSGQNIGNAGGILTTDNGLLGAVDDNEVAIRTQFQLMF